MPKRLPARFGGNAVIDLGSHTRIGATGAMKLSTWSMHGGGLPGLCGWPCANYGVYIKGPNNLVDHCDIYDTSGAGIQIYNADGDPPDNNIVRNTRIHDITRFGNATQVWGLIVAGSNNQIYNNVIYNITVGDDSDSNAALAVTGSNNKIWNNTIYNKRDSGIFVAAPATTARFAIISSPQ